MSQVILETKELVKYFHVAPGKVLHAVDKVNLQIHENEILGLVGESGSGKSTYGKVVLGIHDKTAGSVHYKGEKLPQVYTTKDFKKYSADMQMIFQDPYSSLNPRMTVREIIGEGMLLLGKHKKNEITEAVAEWLRKVGLVPDHMNRYPHEFSGGQRQRIGVARAMIVKPKFVVCDEPISALDVSIQAQIINLLDQLKKEMGLTLLFIAHDLSMVRYVSDRMAVMYLGAVVELSTSDNVYFNPKHPYTQMLVSSNPEADPKKERQKKHFLIKGEIPSPINLKKGCRFASRCPKAMDHCFKEDPIWKEVEPNHYTACHLY